MLKKQNEVVKGVDHVSHGGIGEVDLTRVLTRK